MINYKSDRKSSVVSEIKREENSRKFSQPSPRSATVWHTIDHNGSLTIQVETRIQEYFVLSIQCLLKVPSSSIIETILNDLITFILKCNYNIYIMISIKKWTKLIPVVKHIPSIQMSTKETLNLSFVSIVYSLYSPLLIEQLLFGAQCI